VLEENVLASRCKGFELLCLMQRRTHRGRRGAQEDHSESMVVVLEGMNLESGKPDCMGRGNDC
jgi:hypothetical protein